MLGEHAEYAVSVVVPVYNTERYLSTCLDSLLRQTLNDIEIIVVDDGSVDASSRIADEYAAGNENIKVIHQLNQGLGPARNTGIVAAQGEYIGFVDADDWVDERMYESLYLLASGSSADICYTGLKYAYGHGQFRDAPHPYAGARLDSNEEIEAFHMEMYGKAPKGRRDSDIPISCWNAIYKRVFINEHQLLFRNMRSEDRDFNIRCTRHAQRISFLEGCPYFYRREGQVSITGKVSKGNIYECMHLHDVLLTEIGDEKQSIRSECFDRWMGTSTKTFLDLFQSFTRWTKDESEKEELLQFLVDEAKLRGFLDGDYEFNADARKQLLYFLICNFGVSPAKMYHQTLCYIYDALDSILRKPDTSAHFGRSQ